MKRLILITLLAALSFAAGAKNNIKLKIEGPEDSYNMIKVCNQTNFVDFDVTVYALTERDGKLVVANGLGNFKLEDRDDTDSAKAKVRFGQWIGVSLPDGMENVQAVVTYLDLPVFDIIVITLTESSAVDVGEEF